MKQFTLDQVRTYIEARFSGQRVGYRKELSLKCPFHDDSTASLSFNVEKGVWKCHAGCGDGGLIAFEQKLNGGSQEDAAHRIAEVMGDDHLFESRMTRPTKIYPYVDAQGRLLFEKLRYEPKRFVQRRPVGNGYDYKLDGISEKPLYRLPELLTANTICIAEGEKDADNIAALDLSSLDPRTTVAATSNFDGAGKWRDHYAPYFAGKRVIVFEDNDEQGRKHAQRVAESVSRFAVGVRVISPPDVAEHGDISDWLAAGHTRADLVELIAKAPNWRPVKTDHVAFIETAKIAASAPVEVDWLVSGVIPKGANGIVTGEPKAGKSLVMIDLMMALATGTPWLGFKIPRRVKCALISREDYPGMTAQRIGAFYRGTSRPDFENWSWTNTRWQTPTFRLESEEEVNQVIAELKMESVEFAIFDVFRRLHSQDENDNTEMQAMLDVLSRVQRETGAAIALIHHLSKLGEGRIFRRARGASAIDGWTEWAMAVTLTNPDDDNQKQWVRKVEFETKAAAAQSPVLFQIESSADTMRLLTVNP